MQNQEESSWEELTDDDNDDGTVSEINSDTAQLSEWDFLPDLCLEHVFRFLPDRDRCRGALVCHRWYNIMCLPSLWRTHFFQFSGRLSKYKKSDYFSAVAYVRSLGVYLQRLEVCVYPPWTHVVAQRLQQALCGLFSELIRVKAPLQSLSLVKLELDQPSWGTGCRDAVINSLIQFFHSGASNLTSICLRGMHNDMQRVHRSSWAALTSSCPDLKVNLLMEQVVNTDWQEKILVPEIPLHGFEMTAFYSPDESWSATPLLCNILPLYRHSLQVRELSSCLTLDLSNFTEQLDDELLVLVTVCESLVDLKVFAFLKLITVGRLLDTRLTKRTPLNKIKIKIYSVSDNLKELEDQLENQLSAYRQRFPPELDFFSAVYPFI
ncbi:F-box only protein 39-like [Xenentodon cancila]